MADYTLINFQDRGGSNTGKPRISAANLNKMDAAVLDAATHHKRGTFAAMPAASAANKNWIYWAYDTGERFISNGATWDPLPVGNGALQDGAVTLAKLGASVATVLPATGEKAALAGKAGRLDAPSGGINAAPGDLNRYLLQSNFTARFVDIPAAGGGTTTFYETGLWLVSSHYGFSHDNPVTRAAIVMMSHYTDGSNQKRAFVLTQGGFANIVTTSYAVINDGLATAALQVTSSHGNTRTFFQRLSGI